MVSQYFGYACVALYGGAKHITVSDCQCLDPISIITGGRRYAFVIDDDTLCLVRNCYTRQDRHQYVTQSLTTGPNVFVDCVSDNARAEAGPHHRWATAAIWDNITVRGHNLDAQNTCESGTGHGWEGANCVIYNGVANSLVVGSPPGARNWLIGSIGNVSAGGSCHGISSGPGMYDSSGPANAGGANVFPNSLYFAQLQDRLAAPSLQTRDYWLGEIDSFTKRQSGRGGGCGGRRVAERDSSERGRAAAGRVRPRCQQPLGAVHLQLLPQPERTHRRRHDGALHASRQLGRR